MMSRALLYGSLSAAAVAAWTLLELALGFHGPRAEIGRWTGFISIVFPIAAVVLALRSARQARSGLSWSAGMKEGASVSFVSSVLGAAFFWLYFTIINPNFRAGAVASDPAAEALTVLASGLALGLVVSAVAALILRSRSPTLAL